MFSLEWKCWAWEDDGIVFTFICLRPLWNLDRAICREEALTMWTTSRCNTRTHNPPQRGFEGRRAVCTASSNQWTSDCHTYLNKTLLFSYSLLQFIMSWGHSDPKHNLLKLKYIFYSSNGLKIMGVVWYCALHDYLRIENAVIIFIFPPHSAVSWATPAE